MDEAEEFLNYQRDREIMQFYEEAKEKAIDKRKKGYLNRYFDSWICYVINDKLKISP